MGDTNRLTADDLFAGAGGWDVAADWLDVHARGIENMPQARATRDAAGLTTIHDDVWTFQPDGEASGLIASPPCQTFSQAGKGAGRKALDDVLGLVRSLDVYRMDRLRERAAELGDDRTALVLAPLHYALTNPAYRWLAWEQVPTVLPVWEACADRLRAQGWSVWTGNLQAEQYGVGQTRKRAGLIASRDHEVTPPTPTHSRYYPRTPERLDEGVAKWVSMAEALAQFGWVPTDRVVSNYGTGGDPSTRGVRTADQPAATVTSKVDRNKVLPDWCARRPATTVVGSFKPEVIAAPGYRTTVSRQNAPDSVQVTVAEAGVLQSFPAEFPWQGAKGKQYLQAGNAIPPLLAAAALSAALGEPFVPPALTTITEPAQSALATL